MAYTFDQIFAVDEANSSNVAKNASVLIFAPGDATKTPLVLTTTDGSPLANPIQVNSAGFGPAFMHATLDRVAWEGGSFGGFFTSYDGMKNEAVAARAAADSAASAAADAAALVGAPADTAVAALVGNPATDTGAALNATYAPAAGSTAYAAGRQSRPGRAYTAALGDSLSYGQGNGSPLRLRDDWYQQFCARTRQKVRYGGVFATGGYSLAQIRDTHLPSVLTLTPKPSACFVFGGTNDVGAVGYNQAATLAVLDDICRQLRESGILPVLVALLPRNDAADGLQQKWNVGLRAYGDRNGLPVLDMGPALLTPTGVRDAALYSDNVHPNVAGHTAMAKRAAADPVVELFERTQFTSKISGDASNLIPSGHGLFAVDTDANGLADGWTGVGSLITFSRVAPAAGEDISGQWQRIVRATGGATGTAYQKDLTTGYTAGDRVAFAGRFRATVEGTGSVYTIQAAWIGVTVQNLEAVFNWTKDVPDGAFYVEGVVPAGATALRVQVIMTVPTSGTPQLDVAELTVTNLTASGALL